MKPGGRQFFIFLLISFLIFGFLTGCGNGNAEPTQVLDLPDSSNPSPTIPIEPSPTPTPQPGKVVLISNGTGQADWALVQEKVSILASGSGFTIESRSTLQVSEITSDWKVVVLQAYDPTLTEALAAAPGTHLIVYSDKELGMAANLSVIRVRNDYQAFIAGYLSILITPDWRVGGLFPPDESGTLSEEAYLNGAHYFCGICNSILSPIVRFPVSTRVSGESDAVTWLPELDALVTNIVYAMYVSPGSSNPALLADLAQRGMVLVGGETPADDLRPRWAATVKLDYSSPLEQVWVNIVEGGEEISIDTPVLITDINEEFYSPGRQLRVLEVLDDLSAGWIHPMDVPVQ